MHLKKSDTFGGAYFYVQELKKANNMFVRSLKSVGRFIVEHPVESLEIAGVVIVGTAKAISFMRGSSSGGTHGTSPKSSSSSSNTSNVVNKVEDIVKK